MSYLSQKRARRRGRLPKQARREVQTYVQHQFNRYQRHQQRRAVGRMVLGALAAGFVGALVTVLYLRVLS